MKFRTVDNRIFSGGTAEDVLRGMRDRGFYPASPPSLNAYMDEVKNRLSFYNNEDIDIVVDKAKCEEFLQMLVDKGYFEKI
jgi:hypothetical protein